jgi:sugar phosphate isomerase/epimerase
MKASCLPVSFFPQILNGQMSVIDWARSAKNLGLDAIDISVMFVKTHTPKYLSSLKRDLDSVGMGITMITAYPDFSHPDAIQRERELDYLRGDIAVASFMEAKYLRITAGQAHPESSIQDGKRWVVESFKAAAEIADKYKIRLVYENHSKPGAWQYPDFSYATEVFLDVARMTEDTSIGINFDTANTLSWGDDPIPVLQQVMHRVETVHAAETAKRGDLVPVALGEGIVPFRDLFHILKINGFDNWICIEEASGKAIEGVKKATQFVRKTWADA